MTASWLLRILFVRSLLNRSTVWVWGMSYMVLLVNIPDVLDPTSEVGQLVG